GGLDPRPFGRRGAGGPVGASSGRRPSWPLPARLPPWTVLQDCQTDPDPARFDRTFWAVPAPAFADRSACRPKIADPLAAVPDFDSSPGNSVAAVTADFGFADSGSACRIDSSTDSVSAASLVPRAVFGRNRG